MRSSHHADRRRVGHSRRDVLRVGGLTALGLGLADLFARRRASAAPRRAGRAKSCVLVWLDGGPSHLETFDPKPDAPPEVRGPLGTVATSVPGVRFGECLPKTAAMLGRFAVVRSMTSPLGEHNFGTHYLMTGHKPTPVLEYPGFGAVLAGHRDAGGTLPPNVAVPDFRVGGSSFTGGGYLSASARPFSVGADPARPDFAVRDLDVARGLDVSRLERRRGYVGELDRLGRALDAAPPSDPDLDRAVRLITSPEAKRAFDLGREPPEVRQRYGERTVGQACLLARRLVERGVPFVTVNQRGWDTHANLVTQLKDGFAGSRNPVGLVPSLDLALTALVGDLAERGLLDETLVVVMGEFGRTPKLNTTAGRDHWPRVFSVALAGGGVPGGLVLGSSDATAESPEDRPVTPADLAATVYALLGIDPASESHAPDGRPVTLTPHDARVVPELIG